MSNRSIIQFDAYLRLEYSSDMENTMIRFKLDDVLAKRDVTKYRLAVDTGIAHSTLWKLENGKASSISYGVLEKICRFLDCGPSDILHIEDDEPKKAAKKSRKGGQ
jgi:putative transcriptional regulator